jgi:hypothetical protein
LEQQYNCLFLSLEEFFLARYPSYDQYRSHREEAYQLFEQLVDSTVQDANKPIVFEEVGISSNSQMLIQNIQQKYNTVFVKVIASERLCINRITTRSTSSNFAKTPETVQRVHRQFLTEVSTRYPFAVEIENENISKEGICKQLGVLFHQ